MRRGNAMPPCRAAPVQSRRRSIYCALFAFPAGYTRFFASFAFRFAPPYRTDRRKSNGGERERKSSGEIRYGWRWRSERQYLPCSWINSFWTAKCAAEGCVYDIRRTRIYIATTADVNNKMDCRKRIIAIMLQC